MTTTEDQKKVRVLIAAGGLGQRFASDMPKQYCTLNGKAILRHTIEQFKTIAKTENIHVIIDPDHLDYYRDATKGMNLPAPIHGGESRKESVFNGLKKIPDVQDKDIILIHDGARPFFAPRDVAKMVHELQHCKAVTLCRSITDTLYDTQAQNYPERDNLKALQTPQGFHYATILQAHEKYKDQDGFTDDTSLVRALGEDVIFIQSSTLNFKITTQEDFDLAQALMNKDYQTRSGLGFDVHAFDFEKKTEHIRLGGIDIPYEYGLKGHSDADVVLHAITDAILGSIGMGDIGQHFPPSDNAFKGMDSAVFLQKALEFVHDKNASIINIDVSIICETPKIGPHKDAMQKRITALLGLNQSDVNIKATTTEKLGFTGRGEGIAAQALANISVPT
ncbi:MAG: bifunctional 2-C-methyl-D-erythritol 4-phosphate cytidylyltransferase/2-C-methyl-D-erythritol 2,4-cyclodiphosphate synthase [Alphaproteobacteria bacterium]